MPDKMGVVTKQGIKAAPLEPEAVGAVVGQGPEALTTVPQTGGTAPDSVICAGHLMALEYKASLRTHADSGKVYKPLETASLKTIAAFSNSRDGGTLLIGVADDGTVCGLAGTMHPCTRWAGTTGTCSSCT